MVKQESFSVKEEMKKAVMQLMGKKSYLEITVTDIVNTAGVARASFYRNFNSISDVIDAIVEDLAETVSEDFFPVLSGSDERKWREFLFSCFYHFNSIKKEAKEIKFENLSVIFTRMNELIQKKENTLSQSTIQDKYRIIAKWGLIDNIIRKWIDTGTKETPEEMIDYIMSFITKF